jgi:hypothetical protein
MVLCHITSLRFDTSLSSGRVHELGSLLDFGQVLVALTRHAQSVSAPEWSCSYCLRHAVATGSRHCRSVRAARSAFRTGLLNHHLRLILCDSY